LLALSLGRWLLQFLIVYLWLVCGAQPVRVDARLHRTPDRLRVLAVSALMGRIAASLPVMFVAAIAVIAVSILVRFIGLFFGDVERGQTSVNWLPKDLARPTSVLLQISVILGALVFGAPVVTGDPEGALSRVGTVALAALALSSTPLLATALVGVSVVYLRRLRPGEFAEIGDHSGTRARRRPAGYSARGRARQRDPRPASRVFAAPSAAARARTSRQHRDPAPRRNHHRTCASSCCKLPARPAATRASS
jgi:hypothetical protein